jgi:F0F1-type ATP synthase assembly protein I
VTTPRPATTAQQLHSSHGSFELVLSPVILALLGLWLDRSVLDTTPVLTIVCAVLGFVGAAVKLYYGYRAKMAEHAAAVPVSRPAVRSVER